MKKENLNLTEEELQYSYVEVKGERIFVEGNALDFLEKRIRFIRMPATIIYEDDNGNENKITGIAFALNMGDVFYWGCADLEYLPYNEIENIFNCCFDEKGMYLPFGDMKWCCLKRGMRPQEEWVKRIKEQGYWDDKWESLPEREIDFFNPDFDYPEKCEP